MDPPSSEPELFPELADEISSIVEQATHNGVEKPSSVAGTSAYWAGYDAVEDVEKFLDDIPVEQSRNLQEFPELAQVANLLKDVFEEHKNKMPSTADPRVFVFDPNNETNTRKLIIRVEPVEDNSQKEIIYNIEHRWRGFYGKNLDLTYNTATGTITINIWNSEDGKVQGGRTNQSVSDCLDSLLQHTNSEGYFEPGTLVQGLQYQVDGLGNEQFSLLGRNKSFGYKQVQQEIHPTTLGQRQKDMIQGAFLDQLRTIRQLNQVRSITDRVDNTVTGLSEFLKSMVS